MRKLFPAFSAAVLAVLSCGAPPAHAAPFCVEADGMPAECWYHDIGLCKQEADRKRGYCTVNREEIAVPGGDGAFCMVDSTLVPLCAFQHGESCYESAARSDAVCFENTQAGGDPSGLGRARYRD